jgi:hypothetical protein
VPKYARKKQSCRSGRKKRKRQNLDRSGEAWE